MPLLQLKSISKSFSGIHALENVSFSIEAGEIHAICGENGAGKSTLIKILSGVYPHNSFSGEIIFDDEKISFNNIHDAEKNGIVVIHQELSLLKNLSVAENIFLGREPNRFGIIDNFKLYAETKKLLLEVGLPISPETKVSEIGIGEQQLVEVAKAIHKKARLLILDEPTTALSQNETERLMNILRALNKSGVTIIYISHKLNEVMKLANRITVLRDGRFISTKDKNDITESGLIKLMVGREIKDFYPRIEQKKGEEILSVKNLSVFDDSNAYRKKVDDVSFEIFRGEILGISGLMGSGRTELLMSIFGAWKGKTSGKIFLKGKYISISSPSIAIKNGLALVTEDRKRFGLILNSSIGKNLSLSVLKQISSNGILNLNNELKQNSESVNSLGIKTKSTDEEVNILSGGNQQKVVIGKWLQTNPQILFLDEPTRGVDVGAKTEIYSIINELVKRGMAVVIVSSDLPEVLGISHRILVMSEGKITAELNGKNASQEEVMSASINRERKVA